MAQATRDTARRARTQSDEIDAQGYAQLVAYATELRLTAGNLPEDKGVLAASIAMTIFSLHKGNIRIRIGMLAKALHINRTTLDRSFSALKYPSAKTTQRKIRNEAARRMLDRCPTRKIESIAAELGYRELSAFTKFFKSVNGITPLDYRKARQEKIRKCIILTSEFCGRDFLMGAR